jgi:hypothetical protein
MRDLGNAFHLDWRNPESSEIHGRDVRIVYSVAGPPYVELIEASEGTPWAPGSEPATPHHLGYWSSDLGQDLVDLAAVGYQVCFDGRDIGRSFVYLKNPALPSLLVELLDITGRPAFMQRWGIDSM